MEGSNSGVTCVLLFVQEGKYPASIDGALRNLPGAPAGGDYETHPSKECLFRGAHPSQSI